MSSFDQPTAGKYNTLPVFNALPTQQDVPLQTTANPIILQGAPVGGFLPEGTTLPSQAFAPSHSSPLSHSTTEAPLSTSTLPSSGAHTTASSNTTSSSTPSTTAPSSSQQQQQETPNIPALAQSLVDRVPTTEQLKAHTTALVDKSSELAAQAQAKAGEFVEPKSQEDMNESEAHLDNLTRGVAGMIVTAPLAGLEAITPIVSQKLNQAQEVISAHLQNARDAAVPVANNYSQQAQEYVKNVLPESLGGNSSASPLTGTTPSTTTATSSSTGPTLQERVTSSLTSVAQSAHSTATAYLPEAITNKLPAPPTTTSSSDSTSTSTAPSSSTSGVAGGAHTATSTSVDLPSSNLGQSPYVPLADDKPTSTLPSNVNTSAIEPTLASGPGASQKYVGLAPATTAGPVKTDLSLA